MVSFHKWQQDYYRKQRDARIRRLEAQETRWAKRERLEKFRNSRKQLMCTHQSTCETLRKHSEDMKDDPEHLTTEFLKKLIKVDCEAAE